eukprot:1136789-Pelagomonas_calceolata.AAC.15
MHTQTQSIQQEVAYRASAPAPPPSKHTPTPQELDAAVAARLHRPHPSAARAAAAAASITAAGAAHTSRKSGKSEEEGGGGGAQQQQQQQRLQQRRRQQAKMEAGGAGEDHHSLPMSAGESDSHGFVSKVFADLFVVVRGESGAQQHCVLAEVGDEGPKQGSFCNVPLARWPHFALFCLASNSSPGHGPSIAPEFEKCNLGHFCHLPKRKPYFSPPKLHI